MVGQGIQLWPAVQNIWLFAATYNINIIVSHNWGSENRMADMLSRWQQIPDNVHKLHYLIEIPVWINRHIDLTLLNCDI